MKPVLIVMAVLALIAVGGSVTYQTAVREQEYRQLLAAGDAAAGRGELSAAIENYSGASALRPDSMLAFLRRGETYRRVGDLEAAVRDFRSAAALDTTATRPLEQWGDALYQQQRYERAAEVYEARIRLDDRSALFQYKVGLARYRDGNLDGALEALAKAIELDDQLAEAHYLTGVCLKDKRDLPQAAEALETAVSRSPGMVAAHEELADVYGKLGRRSDEIEQLQILAGLDASRVERRIAVGLAHARAGHPDLAVLALGTALEQAPDEAIVYGALGRIWLDLATSGSDRPDAIGKALEALERAASSSTATSAVKALYGRALMHDQQFEAAEQVLRQATERFPVEPRAFADYAAVAEQQRHLDAARTALVAYNALVGDDRDFPTRAFKIGTLSLALSDPATAVAWLERASAVRPNDVNVWTALADAALRTGDKESARQAIDRGLRLEPESARLRALLRKAS